MTVEQELQGKVEALRKRDPRLTALEAEAQVLNRDHDLYERYRRAPQATIPAEPETRVMPAGSAAEAEAFTRAEGLMSKSSGALTMNDALSRVFRQDPELYREYVLSTQVDTPAEETPPSAPPAPVVKVVEHPLAGDLLALATLFAPSDPEGMGMVKCRQALGLLRQTVERKKGAAA